MTSEQGLWDSQKMRWKVAILLVMLGSPAAAESVLQQFEKTLPPAAKFDFAAYQSCALIIGIDKKREGATFDEIEYAIAKACKKHVTAAGDAMRRAGVSNDEQSRLVTTFSRLAFAERQLRFQGRPIPGYEPSPMAKCLDTKSARLAIEQCFVDQTRLVRSSDELPETIATAVDAACQAPKAMLFRQLMTCTGVEGATDVVEKYAARLRAEVVSAIVKDRIARGVQPHSAR